MGKLFIAKDAAVSSGNAQKVVEDVPVGRYAALGLVIEGTTDTDETLAPSDIGQIRIERNGRQIISGSYSFFHELTKMKFGRPEATLPTAGATRIFTLIPFFYNFRNTLDVTSKDEVDVFIDFGANMPTRFGSNAVTYELTGLTAPAVAESYEMQIRQQDVVADSAGILPTQLDARDVAGLLISDAGDVVSQFQLEVDDKTLYQNIDDDTLTNYSNVENLVEAADLVLTEVPVAEVDLQEAVNRNVKITPTFTGSGTLSVNIISFNRNVDVQGSRARVAQFLNSITG